MFLECGNRVAAFSFCALARADSWQNLSKNFPYVGHLESTLAGRLTDVDSKRLRGNPSGTTGKIWGGQNYLEASVPWG